MVITENLCPVCGFEMQEPPEDYNICPSCGTEFGVNNVNATEAELREAWIATGPKWWSETDAPPVNWNPFEQLARIPIRRPAQALVSFQVNPQEQVQATSTLTPANPISWITDWTQTVAPRLLERVEDKQLAMGFE